MTSTNHESVQLSEAIFSLPQITTQSKCLRIDWELAKPFVQLLGNISGKTRGSSENEIFCMSSVYDGVFNRGHNGNWCMK
jgi:hypothetical protein